jgi:hypothetical protein
MFHTGEGLKGFLQEVVAGSPLLIHQKADPASIPLLKVPVFLQDRGRDLRGMGIHRSKNSLE